MALNIADLFEHAVDAAPDKPAVKVGTRTVTYAELESEANKLAHYLQSQGVQPGDHVAVYAKNSIEHVVAVLAIVKIRAVNINVNYRYVEGELNYLFDNADVVALIVERTYAPLVAKTKPNHPKLKTVVVVPDVIDPDDQSDISSFDGVLYADALAGQSDARDFAERSADDLHIIYTGGTTGFPKGVMWRHEDVFRTLGGGIDFQTGEKVTDEFALAKAAVENPQPNGLVLAPLMHGAAQWGTLGGLFKGITNVLLERFDPHAVWQAVETYKVAVISITGDAMARPLIDALKEKSYDTSSLVAMASTAAVFSPVVKDELFELLPNLFISEAVGSSEGGFNGMRLVEKGNTTVSEGGLINVPLGPDSKIIGLDDKPVQPGEIGRLARGGNVPLGYYKDPEKTAATFLMVEGERHAVPGLLPLFRCLQDVFVAIEHGDVLKLLVWVPRAVHRPEAHGEATTAQRSGLPSTSSYALGGIHQHAGASF